MLFFFKPKSEVVTRSYDVTGAGFAPLPVNREKISDNTKFHWSIGLAKDIFALFSSIFLSSIAYGILMVMIAFKMEEFVKNEVLISVSSATQIIAGVIFSRFLPKLGQKVGMTNTIYFGSTISAISAILMYSYSGYFLWLLTIFLFGISAFVLGVTRQTVMIDIAPPHMRAMIISLGSMLVAIGNSLGPIFLEMLKTSDSFLTFAIACSLYLASMLPLSRLKKSETNIREEKKIGLWRYIQNSPKIMLAGFVVNYALSSANSFLIIYGIKIGMTQSEASLLLSVLLFGAIFSIPLGYLCDLLNRRFLMIISSGLSLICISLLYLASNPEEIYALLFLLFGCMMGLKLPAIILINEKYKPTQRLAVNSAFSRVSLIGNICGILGTGSIMKIAGPKGLWISIMIVLLLFLLFCCLNYSRKIKRK